MLQNIAILVVSLALIGVLSERIIRYVMVLSKVFGLSEMAAGFILLSVVTSLPELTVSTVAALVGEGGLSTGNVLGANITNLTIVIGLAIFLSKTEVMLKGAFQKELVQFLFISSIIPLFIVQRGSLGPILGIVLLVLFVYFSITISHKSEKSELEPVKKWDTTMVLLKFAVCVAIIVVLAKFAVDSAVYIAELNDLPPAIVGATIVSFGTTIPELATTIQALRKKLFGMAMGNLLGSCITNLTLILGVSSLISGSEVNVVAVQSIMFYVLLSSLSVWYMVGVHERIGKRAALLLCMIYAAFILQQIGVSFLAL